MKNIKIFSGLLVVVMFTLSGCDKALEVKTISSITNASYWNKPGDVSGYLTGIYTKLRDNANTTYYLEDRGDSYSVGLEAGVTNAWRQNLNKTTAPNWVNFYNLIHHCNLLLKYGADIPFAIPEDKQRIFAQTYFIRAFTYFTLIKSWGDVPLVLQPTESADRPMPPRTSASEVMSQLLKDVDQAIELFPEDGFINKSLASKPACYALKANALVWKAKVLGGDKADLTAALKAIEELELASGLGLEADFGNIFSTANRNGKEIIFSLHFERDEKSGMYGKGLKPRDIFVQTAKNKNDLPYARSGARSNYQPSPKIMSLLNEHPSDQRKDASVITAVDKGGDIIGVFGNKFRGTAFENDREFDNDIVIYRMGGLILLKAEILAALNKVPQAVTELNKIRRRAHIGDYSGPTDKLTVEKAILKERFKELWNERKRWSDLVRFHMEGVINVYETVPNLAGEDVPLYFPIPQEQIDINGNLSQTEGYSN